MNSDLSNSQKVLEIETEWITLSDGCRLAARLWIPENAEKNPVPAILEILPYRRRDYTRLRGDQLQAYLADHGYACARVDLRGSGDSERFLEGEYLQQELDDACEVIAWLAAQPWCSGAVGMTGISWGGFNSLQVAALQPPALKAIITACSTDDRYADDVHYMGGCLISENLEWASTMFGFNSRPPDPEVVGEGWRETWIQRLEKHEPWIFPWLTHQLRDDFWKHGSVCEDFSKITCAVFAVGGWADGYSNAIPRLLAGLSAPRKGLIGPWTHNWPNLALPGPAIGYLQEALRWWDHWLKGKPNGVMEEPMLRVWMQDSLPPAPQYDHRPGRWVSEESWPSDRITPTSWHLNADGLGEEAGAETAISQRSPQGLGLTGGEWCPYGLEAEMPVDQRAEDGQSISFDSAPLVEPLEILGAPEITLSVAVDRPTAFLCVRLNDVAPDGSAAQITYGLLNLTHDEKHEKVSPIQPGERLRVMVRLNDIAQQLPSGHRLRVAVSTSYWPRVWPSPEPVTLTVFTGDSSLSLPIRPPRQEDGNLSEFDLPAAAKPSPHRFDRPPGRSRKIEHDIASQTVTLTGIKDRGLVYLEEIDLSISARAEDRFTLVGDDPLSARHENTYEISMARKAWQIRTIGRTVMTATAKDYHLSASMEAFEGPARVFVKTWNRKIPRDGT
ncbi:MAG: CocE/NonD family hydrolase [Pseudomonadota bacterium]